MKTLRLAVLAAGLALLGACAVGLPTAAPRVLVFGEQHDQPDQQRQVADTVRELAAQGRLQAVVLEMADQGAHTRALAPSADDAAARQALAWNEDGWPWAQYGPVVMAAVRAGVPVFGGNLPRSQMRAAMGDAALDARVPARVRQQLLEAVRDGHCGLLPEAQLAPMTRIQIARDHALAQALVSALPADGSPKQVLLLAGEQHASRDRGVPLHLATLGVPAAQVRVVMFGGAAGSGLQADERRTAETRPTPDHCEGLRQRFQPAQ